jgi:formyl-CoA transferase
MPLTGVFETQDGAVVVVGAFKENPLRAICMALEIPDLSSEPKFATLDEQIKNKRELQTMFRERYRTNTTAHWLARLEAQDLLCAPVRSLREALADPQTAHNEMVLDGHDGEQAMRLIGSPIRMSNAPVRIRRAPPRLGEHTEEVLAESRAMAAANLGR